MRLLPYIQSAFYRYATEGIPPFRAPIVDYPDEAESWHRDDQILIGDRLMAAPLSGEATNRPVWLPPGTWADFWSGEPLEGNRVIEVVAPPERLPLFVKSNSVLPLATATAHTDDPSSFELEVRIYGDRSLSMPLVEEPDDNLPFHPDRVTRLDVSSHAR
ncbi:MAG: hypothetical protein WDO13_08230 [Verrucomicrobiota bacterium]